MFNISVGDGLRWKLYGRGDTETRHGHLKGSAAAKHSQSATRSYDISVGPKSS